MYSDNFELINIVFMSAYSKILIYYFSGTGNSKNVATWLSDTAQEHQINITLINIAHIDRKSITASSEDTLIIFISPIHGFNYPPIMLNFILHFPKGKNKIVLMNTRAGMLIHKWVTPGLTGAAFYFSAMILLLKGYIIKGIFPVDLPSNWISFHPGLNERTVIFIHQKMKTKVFNFAQRIFSGRSDFRSLKEAVQDIFISPISMLYYFIGRFFLAKTFYASSSCDNCNVCLKNCPVKAIIVVDKRPFWTYKCESCMKCMGNCPKKAIETAHGFTFGIWLVYSSLIMITIYKYLSEFSFPPKNSQFRFVFESLVFLATMFIGYRLMHYLLRFKFFERIVVYTSLTKYKFWGKRYKALKP